MSHDHKNRVRSESAEEAARIDERIAVAWSRHPHRFFVDREGEFMLKAAHALELIGAEISTPRQAPPQARVSPVPGPALQDLRQSTHQLDGHGQSA